MIGATQTFVRPWFLLLLGLAVVFSAGGASAQSGRTDHIVRSSDGVALAVQEWGDRSKPSIMLVHGYMQSHLSWSRQVETLSRNFHVVTLDLRGHGASDKPTDAASYRDAWRWADDIDAALRATGSVKPVLVGWSMGGRVLLDYVEKYGQDNVAGFIFVDSGLSGKAEYYSPENRVLLRGLRSSGLEDNIANTSAFLRACFHIQPTPADFAAMLAYNMVIPPPVRTLLAGRPLDFDAALAAIRRPTLVIQGRKDALVYTAASEYTAKQVPGAKLIVYDNSGHSPFYEEADRFNADVAAFASMINRAAKP